MPSSGIASSSTPCRSCGSSSPRCSGPVSAGGHSSPASPLASAAALLLALGLVLAPAAPALAQTDPSGNNGTVKVHDGGLEPSPEIRNQPHVCTFHLHFFFADAAQTGAWWIKSWSPTG